MIQKLKAFWSKTNRWHIGLVLFVVVELQLVPGGVRGFHCNDPALSHKYTGDTISWKLMLATTILLPLVIILIVERSYGDKTERAKKQAMRWYKEYLFGFLITLVVTQSLKLIVGSPRPHFFDTCGPKEALTCQGSEYVARYSCTRGAWVAQSARSFPSGHTSLALYAALFLQWYLRRRVPLRVAAGAGGACGAAAVACAVSRLTDRRHHLLDVAVGALIALATATYAARCLCARLVAREEEAAAARREESSAARREEAPAARREEAPAARS